MKAVQKLLLTFACVIGFLINCEAQTVSPPSLFIEIYAKDGIKQIVIAPSEITEVGIDEKGVAPSIVIRTAPKHHVLIEELTRENVRQKAVIRIGTETVFSGTIVEAIPEGKIVLMLSSSEQAEDIVRKMGREPDYHRRFSPAEMEAIREAEREYKESPKSPWADKAGNAMVNSDLWRAEQYAKKAIESDPNEGKYHALLSGIYYKQGEKKLALEELLTAERLSTKQYLERAPGIYLSIADLYSQFDEYGKALEYVNKVLSKDKGSRVAHFRLAAIYERMGKYDLAVQEYSFLAKASDEPTRNKALEGLERLEGKRGE